MDDLAFRVRQWLRHGPDADALARHVWDSPDPAAAVAAIRILGADSASAHRTHGQPLSPADADLLADAAAVTGPGVLEWQSWGLRRLLDDRADPPAALLDAGPPHLAALAALAVPGIDSAVHTWLRSCPILIARAVTRAMLRRDHPTAAALARWLAWSTAHGVPPLLDVRILVTHLRHVGGDEPRTALDIDLAQRVLDGKIR